MFPFFNYLFMDEAEIIKIIEQKTAENDYNDCYLVDLEYNKPNNHLTVFIGSDSGMTLAKCQAFSRHIEAYLDETLILGEKYELDVSSPGVGRPLKLTRQYYNNIGRDLKVWLEDGTRVKGKLLDVDEDKIVLSVKKGRGRKKEEEELEISFDQINKALVQIKF